MRQPTDNQNPPSSSLLRILGLIVGLALTAFSLLAFLASGSASSAEDGAALPTVTVAHPTLRDLTEWDEYTGRFVAVEDVEVRSRVSGYLQKISFVEGALVKVGDTLYTIDPRPFKAAAISAEAEVTSARAALETATLEAERGVRLRERQAISDEDAQTRSRDKIQAEAALAAALGRLQEANLNLEFAIVKAPVDGRISTTYVTKGNLIVGGSGGTLLTRIVSTDPIYLEFTANEAAYIKYKRLGLSGERPSSRDNRNPVYARLLDEPDFLHEGYMSFVDNRLDPSTGTMRGRATFDNSGSMFVPGMFARLRLPGSGAYKATLIPDEAVQTDQSEKFVWVVSDSGEVSRRVITLGPLSEKLRIVRSGLEETDKVIVKGTQFVAQGARVNAQFETQNSASGTASDSN